MLGRSKAEQFHWVADRCGGGTRKFRLGPGALDRLVHNTCGTMHERIYYG